MGKFVALIFRTPREFNYINTKLMFSHSSDFRKTTNNEFLTELIKLTSLLDRPPLVQHLSSYSHIYGMYIYNRSHALA